MLLISVTFISGIKRGYVFLMFRRLPSFLNLGILWASWNAPGLLCKSEDPTFSHTSARAKKCAFRGAIMIEYDWATIMIVQLVSSACNKGREETEEVAELVDLQLSMAEDTESSNIKIKADKEGAVIQLEHNCRTHHHHRQSCWRLGCLL